MPAKLSLAEIEAKIAMLQERATAIRAAEREKVVKELRALMSKFHISAAELAAKPARRQVAPVRATRRGERRSRAQSALATTRVAKKRVVKPKYADGRGNLWTGRGSKPVWVRQAMESGLTLEQLLIER
jgi:DNA-binding protein H-NS